MQIQTIYEVQIKGMHPYPCFIQKNDAEFLSNTNNHANVVPREFTVFNDIAEYESWKKGKQLDDLLGRLTDVEQRLLETHYKQLYTQR